MSTKRATKRALLTSILAICLCLVMLIGSTFAWFTDSASTSVNKIQAGTLKVDIQNKAGKSLDGVTMEFEGNGRDTNKLWEPGATYQLAPFKIVNQGNLALKFKIVLNGFVGDEKLLEAIDFTYKTTTQVYEDVSGGNGFYGWVTKEVELPLSNLSEGDGTIIYAKGTTYGNALDFRGETNLITIVGHMREDAGNEYQGLSLEGLGITVLATQATAENDYFDDQYDKYATYAETTVEGKTFSSGKHTLVDGVIATGPNGIAVKATGSDTEVTIENGSFDGGSGGDNQCVQVSDNATVIIKGGTFTVGGDANGYGNSVIYTSGGNVVIEDGFFYTNYSYDGKYYVLNQNNGNPGTITVKGGIFVNYDPSTGDDNLGGNFVADGYKVETVQQDNGETWYIVVPNA